MQPEVCRTFFTRNKTRSASSRSLPVGQNQIGYGIGDMLNRVALSAQASLSFHPGRPIYKDLALTHTNHPSALHTFVAWSRRRSDSVTLPMYLQIADDLRRQIESGILARGEKLPTESELGEKYDVSRNTVRDAIGRLTELRLVEPRPGKGTYVTEAIEAFVTDLSPQTGDGVEEGQAYPTEGVRQHRIGSAGLLTVGLLRCPPEVADLLGISPETEVIIRGQDHYIDNVLWSAQTSYYPRKWYDDGAGRLLKSADITEGPIWYLSSALGLKQVAYQDWITVRPTKEDESQRFGLPHTASMFQIYRTRFTADGTAICVTVTLYPADRNQFRYQYSNLPG
jgi:GntR family transcriptional regulator